MAYEVVQVNEDTWYIEEDHHVRFFLLVGTKEALLIDSGMHTQNVKEIVAGITSLPVKLVNTHADPDHIGANGEFEVFYMHPSEASNYYHSQNRTGDFLPVEDGELWDLGDRPLEIIQTPGHTPGSIAILDVKHRALFSGDPIQDGMIFMFGVQREIHAYVKSLQKVKCYADEFDLIYPSHGSIPVKPELIDRLEIAAKQIMDGEATCEEMDLWGNQIKKYQMDCAAFLMP